MSKEEIETQAIIEILESYHQNGGTYIIPNEVIIDVEGMLEDKDKEIERLTKELVKYDETLAYVNNTKDKEIERLNKELKQRTKQYENALKRYQDLENKNAQTEYNNKKAIEYITTEQLYTNYQWGKSQYVKILKDLLDILKGVGKEWK